VYLCPVLDTSLSIPTSNRPLFIAVNKKVDGIHIPRPVEAVQVEAVHPEVRQDDAVDHATASGFWACKVSFIMGMFLSPAWRSWGARIRSYGRSGPLPTGPPKGSR